MKESKKNILINLGIIIFVLLLVSTVFYFKSKTNNPDEELVKCIGEKATLYIQEGCHACEKQKDKFGNKLELINVVDCTETTEICLEKNIRSVPTWIIGDKLIESVLKIDELKEIIGC